MVPCLEVFTALRMKRFLTGHPYIYVYTENERLTYEIYEAAKFTDVYIPSEYVISSKDDRDQFLADVREKFLTINYTSGRIWKSERMTDLSHFPPV